MIKRVITTSLVVSLMLSTTSGWAAITSCDKIIDKINTKLEHKEVTGYSLTIVSKDTETKSRVVGVCEGGSKKIIYKKKRHASKKDDADTSDQSEKAK